MTLINEAKISDFARPEMPQKRIAVTPSGREVWVEITQYDRLRLIDQLPGRWPEVMKARERGETLDQIARWTKVPTPCQPQCRTVAVAHDDRDDLAELVHEGPECLRFLMARCYAVFETELANLANRRAKMMV